VIELRFYQEFTRGKEKLTKPIGVIVNPDTIVRVIRHPEETDSSTIVMFNNGEALKADHSYEDMGEKLKVPNLGLV
jgi:hypothetical protein